MATTEAAPASLGPRFAPEDPALPKPWKGLIDGSTGLLYYWNPETNVTQYERPATSAPPLPPGPPPSASLPNLAPIPIARTVPPNGTVQQQPRQQLAQQAGQQVQQQQPSQQVFQQEGQLTQQQQKLSQQLPLQQLGQQMTLQQSGQQVALQQTQQLPYQQPQQVSNQQFTQQRTPRHFSHMQLQQMPYQQISYLQGQLMPRPEGQQQQGLQFASYQQGQQSQGPQVSYQQGQQPQGPQIPHQQQTQESQMMLQQQPQGSQVPHSQGLQIAAQLLQHTQGPPIAQQQGQQSQGSHIGNQLEQKKQGQQVGLPGVEEATRQEGKQAGLSLPQVQQSSLISGNHHLPSSLPQVNISPVGSRSIQPQQQFGGASPVSAQQNSSLQLQPVGIDTSYRQQQTSGTTVPNQLGHPMVCPPMGLNMGYDDDQHERGRTEFYSSRRMEEPMMLPQQPLARSQQDMRMSHQFIPPGHSGGLNMLPQHPLPNMYSHAAFPNPAALRPPLGMFGSSDFPNISSADAYRRHHEVTAMGDNVPAPFMTFESTGFPPEILREMHLAGFLSPTPIQAQTWPVALQKRDVVAIAKTGSGKTLAVFTPTATRDEELSIEESSQAIIFRENSDSAVVQPENSAHMSAEISASAPIVSENAEESLTSEIPATEGRSTSVIATEASANAAKEQGDFTVDLQLQREDTPVADFSAENSATAKFVAPPRSSGFLPDSSNHIEPIHSQEDAKITTRAVINIQRPTTMQLTAWIDRYEEPKRKFGTFRKGTIGKGML